MIRGLAREGSIGGGVSRKLARRVQGNRQRSAAVAIPQRGGKSTARLRFGSDPIGMIATSRHGNPALALPTRRRARANAAGRSISLWEGVTPFADESFGG